MSMTAVANTMQNCQSLLYTVCYSFAVVCVFVYLAKCIFVKNFYSQLIFLSIELRLCVIRTLGCVGRVG